MSNYLLILKLKESGSPMRTCFCNGLALHFNTVTGSSSSSDVDDSSPLDCFLLDLDGITMSEVDGITMSEGTQS